MIGRPRTAATASGLRVRPPRDSTELVQLLTPYEPRTTNALSEVLLHGLDRRHVRASIVDDGATVLAVVVVTRAALDLWLAWSLLLDDRAAADAAHLVDISPAIALNGVDVDVVPLLPHLTRVDFHRVLPWYVSRHPHDVLIAPSEHARLATLDDLDALVDLYRHYEYGFESTVDQLRATLRDSLRHRSIVVAEIDGKLAGGIVVTAETTTFQFWDSLTVLPEHRRSGLTWRIGAYAQDLANARGLSGCASAAASNPITVEIALQQDYWITVSLHPLARFRGHNRLRRMWISRRGRQFREPELARDPLDPTKEFVERTRVDDDGRVTRD